jgi:hypothetical protein
VIVTLQKVNIVVTRIGRKDSDKDNEKRQVKE